MVNISLEQHVMCGGGRRVKKGVQKDGCAFLELPEIVLLQISEYVGLKDLPNLLSCCRFMAVFARTLYSERRVVDMRCFSVVTPGLCQQVIERFSKTRLQKCYFQCSVASFESKRQHEEHGTWDYDVLLLESIMRRFLDNWDPTNDRLLMDLRSALIVESTQWNGRLGLPRPIDVLAHCYCLDRLLVTQKHLKELELDIEFSIFRLPGSRSPRHHWQLLKPFVALDAIRTSCESLESYMAYEIRIQPYSMQLPHSQFRFLEGCRKLKSFGITFKLEGKDLEMLDRLSRSLVLEDAYFFMTKWQVSHEQRHINYARLRGLAKKLSKLKCAVITFKARGCLSDLKGFLHHLPCIESLSFSCGFTPGFPIFDIDEGVQAGYFFSDLFLLVPKTVREVTLLAVPEQEFEAVFGTFGPLPSWVRVLRIQFRWLSDCLKEAQLKLLLTFLSSARQLESYRIEGLLMDQPSKAPVFLKMKGPKSMDPPVKHKFFPDAGHVFALH